MAITTFNFMTLANLQTYHGELTAWTQAQIADATASGIKTVSISKDASGVSTMHFYTVAEPVGEAQAAYSIELPHDYYTEAEIDAFVQTINGKIKDADDKAQAAQDAVDELAGKVDVAKLANGETVMGKIAENAEDIADLQAIVSELTGDDTTGGSISDTIDAKIADLKLSETYEPIGKGAEEAGKVQEALNEYMDANDDAVAEAKKAGTDAQTYAEGVNTALEAYKGANDKALADEIARAKEAEQANAKAASDAQATADAKVASVTAGDKSVTVGGTTTAPTVAVKVSADADNAIELAEDGLKVVIPDAAEYSIVKDANSGDFAAVYHLTKDGVNVGSAINIPKDMVVESGAVVENPDADHVGTFIKLVLQNVDEPLYINVGSLIEYVTSGSNTGDMVVVNVSDDHKVTATITDGTITLAKLSTEVQTAIGKAHVHENADVLKGITADKVASWDSAEADAIAEATRLDGVLKGELEDAIADVDAKFADYSTTEQMNSEIKKVDDKFANYKTKVDTEAEIKAVDDKFVNYTNTTAMNEAIAKAKGEAVQSATDYNTAMDARVATLEGVVHGASAIDDEEIRKLFA